MQRIHIPQDARFVVFQRVPRLRVSFIVPAHKKKIMRYMGVGRTGGQRTEWIDVPDMLYTLDVGGMSFKMYIVEGADTNRLMLRPFRMANVHTDDNICWGDNEPNYYDMRGTIATFWGSPFNDDLTPYPRPSEEDWMESPYYSEWQRALEAYERRVESIVRAMEVYAGDASIANRKIRDRINDLAAQDEPMQDRFSECDYRIVQLNATLEYLNDRSLPATHIANKINALSRVKRAYEAVLNRRANYRAGVLDTWARLDVECRMYGAVSILALAECTNDRDRMRQVMAFKGFIREQMRKMQDIGTLSGVTTSEMRGTILHACLRHASRGEPSQDSYRRNFNERWFATSRDEWWGGAWRLYGAISNYKDYIFGIDFQFYPHGCAGALYFDHYNSHEVYGVDSAGNPRNARLPNLCPLFRLPHRDDLLVMVDGEVPFTYTRVGIHWVLEHYDEARRGIQEALTEIFG